MALLLFVATLAIGNCFVSADKAVTRQSAGHDFMAFYTAGTFVRTGRSAELYDLQAVGEFQQRLAREQHLEVPAGVLGPFWNPPFFACAFAPLSALSYPTAWTVWCLINLMALSGAIVLLARMLPGDWRTRGLVPLLIVTCPAFIQALGHGQNTCISLLILSAAVTLWRSDRAVWAGVVTGLLFYKPQLGAIIAAALVISMGWKPLAGLAITGTTLLLATLIALPGTLADYVHRLPGNIAYMQVEHRYLWDRHVTLKAFWRLLLQGDAVGDLTPLTRTLYIASVAILASFLFVTLWKLRNDVRSRDRLIAATIVAMPLLMPFYFDYDLLLLSAAAVLAAREAIDKPSLVLWIGLFIASAINSGIAGKTHVNVSVVLLSALAGTSILRARAQSSVQAKVIATHQPLRQAA